MTGCSAGTFPWADLQVVLPAPDATAVDLWLDLKAQPGYTPGAPITSISTTATVTGTVNDPPSV
jgi:hypothetical protein